MKGRRLVAAGVLVCAGFAASCTDGTTPDCSDAQCLQVIAAGDGGDAQPLAEGAVDSGRAPEAADASVDAGPDV